MTYDPLDSDADGTIADYSLEADGHVRPLSGVTARGTTLPPCRLHTLQTSWTNLGDGAEQTVGSRGSAGYALAYYCGTSGAAPPIASDLDWRFYYDGETTPTFDLVTIGDALMSPAGGGRDARNHGDYWATNADNDSYSYFVFEEPAPYDSVEARVNNPSGANSPEGYVLALVADELSLSPLTSWRRNAAGNEDVAISDASTTTLVDVLSTRGRLYGVWLDVDDVTSLDAELQITFDGDGSPSITLNTGFVNDLFRGFQGTGGGIFGAGEYDSANNQQTFFFTPGALGYYSDFGSSMTIDLVNNGGAGEIDWGVVWDEEI